MRKQIGARLCILACLMLGPVPSFAQFHLRDGDRVVFYGDSITDQRLYTVFTETFVVTRFPKQNVTFIHSGWGGDRVGGGGGGPIDLRLKRDVIAYKPTVMTIMLGMNDASYRAFDQGIFDTYSRGYEHIVSSMKQAVPGIRFTLIQPSPYDDVTRAPGFAGGYNAVLVKYGEFVKTLGQREGTSVADLNTSVVAALQTANASDAPTAQKIIQDRVHPGPGGQLLMAEALLKAWNAPARVTSVELDAAKKRIVRAEGTKAKLVPAASGLSWTQMDDALPMPIDMSDPVVALAVQSSDFVDALNRQPLKVTGLKAGRYALKIDGREVASLTADKLAQGVNLAVLATPMVQQAAAVHILAKLHNDIHFQRWRVVQVPHQNDLTPYQSTINALDAAEAAVIKEQRAAAQPRLRKYEVVPAN